MAIVPVPGTCVTCGNGGGGEAGADVENHLLCDVGPDGEVLGTALAVYEYDSDGNPVGAPTFVDPVTGDPYVAQGVLQPCPGEVGCGAPQRFCFVSSSTFDTPGRQYDLTFSLGQGFAVTGIGRDLDFAATNVLWSVNDADASEFVEDLTAAVQSQFPGATVNIAPGTDNRCVDGTQEFSIHIECLRLDQDPPSLVQLRYNAGRDLILNPAYNEDPPLDPPVNQGNYGFHLLSRQDDPGPFPINQPSGEVNCTNIANRGWETNDVGRTFEIWGQDVQNGQNTTPTPRGTPVQEMSSDGPPPGGRNTIWQTFTVPANGQFNIRVVHGARDPGEEHIISLSTGDTDDNQVGDLILNVTNPPSVTSSGGPNPWTTFNQVINLSAGVYTLALSTTNPAGPNRGGLFTDMRVFVDGPEVEDSFVNDDDTCVVSVTESTTTCEFWAPRCTNGTISHWYNVQDGEELSNADFWAQVPAPQCCETVPGTDGDGGGASTNLIHTYLVCAQTDTGQRTLSRVVITDPNGGPISEQFVDTNGALITPASWQPGQCDTSAAQIDREYEVLCDTTDGSQVVTFLRRYNVDQFGNVTVVDTTLDGVTAYAPVGTVQTCTDCTGVAQLGEFCYQLTGDGPLITRRAVSARDCDGNVTYYDNAGNDITALIEGPTFSSIVACFADAEQQILCDEGNGNEPFLRTYWYNENQVLVTTVDTAINGGAYVVVGPVARCSGATECEANTVSVYELCDAGASDLNQAVTDADPTPYLAFGGNNLLAQTGGQNVWNGGSQVFGTLAEPANPPGSSIHRIAVARITALADCPECIDPDTNVQVTVTLDALLNGPTPGIITDGRFRVIRDDGVNPFTTLATVNDVNRAVGTTWSPVHVVNVPYSDLRDGFIYVSIDLETRSDNGQTQWTVSGFELTLTADPLPGCGPRFFRTITRDCDGAVVSTVDTTDGTTPYVAVGPVGACVACATPVQQERDVEVLTMCDTDANGVNTPFLRRQVFDGMTGALISSTDLTLAGAPYVVTGTVNDGPCPTCCPFSVAEVCLSNGNRGVVIRQTDGTLVYTNVNTGGTFNPATDIVTCPDPVVTVRAHHFDAIPGAPWTPAAIPGGTTLVGLAYTVVAGTVTTVDADGTSIAAIPTGYSTAWNAEDNQNTLIPPQSITAAAASRAIVTMTVR